MTAIAKNNTLNERMIEQKINTPHVCPWWVAYLFDNPIRRMMDPAEKRLADFVKPGMNVMDFGCGFGHYTLGMGKLTGPRGSVWAVDVQEKMLNKTMKRTRKQGLSGVIHPINCSHCEIKLPRPLDFILAGNSLHETPSAAAQLTEFYQLLKLGGRFLLLEPRGHLTEDTFKQEIEQARQAGFTLEHTDSCSRQYIAAFKK